MKKRSYKKNSKYNWREDMDRAIARKQRLEERLSEIKAYLESEETRAALPKEVRERIAADVERYRAK